MTTARANQGPRVAQANRRALIAAARALFQERGADVPMVEIGRRAGVGQGSLYRHFPDRGSIVFAVLEQNMNALEQLGAAGDVTLRQLMHEITHLTEGIAPLMPFVTSSAEDHRLVDLERRMRALFAHVREHAGNAGTVRSDVTIDDLMMAVGMVAALMTSTPAALRRERAEHAWEIIERGLSPQ